jgi:hypothetical protein
MAGRFFVVIIRFTRARRASFCLLADINPPLGGGTEKPGEQEGDRVHALITRGVTDSRRSTGIVRSTYRGQCSGT